MRGLIGVLEDDSTLSQRDPTRRPIYLLRRALSLSRQRTHLSSSLLLHPGKSIKPPSLLLPIPSSLLTQTISTHPTSHYLTQTNNPKQKSTCLQTPRPKPPSATSSAAPAADGASCSAISSEGVVADGVLSSGISVGGVMVGGVLFSEMLKCDSMRGRGCPGVVFGPKIPGEMI